MLSGSLTGREKGFDKAVGDVVVIPRGVGFATARWREYLREPAWDGGLGLMRSSVEVKDGKKAMMTQAGSLGSTGLTRVVGVREWWELRGRVHQRRSTLRWASNS